MFNFRKSLLLVAALGTFAGIASAQIATNATCEANTARNTLARSEGYAEEMGQVVLVCRGGTTGTIQQINVRVFLGTEVTSRLVNSSTAGLESIILVDEPAAGARVYCPAPHVGCAVGSNVFQGQLDGPSVITWAGIPFDPPGTTATRILRIANIRGNATRGSGGGFLPNTISMLITITGTNAPSVTNPLQTVATINDSLAFESSSASFNQCEPSGSLTDGNPTGAASFTVTYKELFQNAFRRRSDVAAGTYQDTLNTFYNSESMLNDAAFPATVGQATQGTRLWLRFNNVPAGVAIYVGNANSAPASTTAWYVAADSSAGDGGTISNGTGFTRIISSTATSRTGVAVWEVTGSDPFLKEDVKFDVFVVYPTNPLPELGDFTVAGNYAPIIDTVSPIASNTPRFKLDPKNGRTYSITPCQTNLLFPFVASVGQFDTGIAVSNTSKDPYGTANQAGKCTFWYYGVGEPTTNPQTTTSDVAAGKQILFSLSSGNAGAGIAGAQGFTGYMIARCNFQYAHGYAFISDIGASDFAQGYLALILDKNADIQNRRNDKVAKTSENLNN